jgi:hypothetical protein
MANAMKKNIAVKKFTTGSEGDEEKILAIRN